MRSTGILILVGFCYLALTGFECASTEMTTAKVALQRRDYVAASAALEKEVAKRPDNGEAWLMLAEMYEETYRPMDALRALTKARDAKAPALTPQQLSDTYIRQFNLWRSAYNRSYEAYRKDDLTRALELLDTATMVAPDNLDNIYFRSTIEEKLGREDAQYKALEDYIAAATPIIEQGTKLGLSLAMTPAQVESILGKATRSEIDTIGGFMYFQNPDLYVYFSPAEGQMLVEGWRTFDKGYPEALRQAAPTVLRARPLILLGERARTKARETGNRSQYDQALKYYQTLGRLDPTVQGVSSLVANIYRETNRVDEALRLLNAEIQANPKSPRNYLELGNIYVADTNYSRAAAAFQKVLDLGLGDSDQNTKLALFNLGAVYKNWGAHLQDSIATVAKDKSKITPAQAEVFMKPLRESAKYFERHLAVTPDDVGVLAELANLYYVLGDDAKVGSTLKQLEGLESKNLKSAMYWRTMSRVYAILGEGAKAEAADKRAETAPEE